MKRIFCVLPLIMFASGCISQQYVAADRATFDALKPALTNYVNGIPCTPAEVPPIRDAITGWDTRTKAGENFGGSNGL